MEGLNQETSYWNLAQVISRAFHEKSNSFKGGFMAWFWTIIQLLIRLPTFYWSYGIKMLYGIWFEIEGLNQEISYWNLAQVISRAFHEKSNSFKGGFISWFWATTQVLIRLSVSFLGKGIKLLLAILSAIEQLNQEISYWNLTQTISRVFQVI